MNAAENEDCVVVTGASTGIGAATARELAGRGFHVLAGVRRDRDAGAVRGSGIENDPRTPAPSSRWRR